jgi:hypothetical protein
LWVIFALLDPNFEYGSGFESLTVALFPQDEEEYNEDIPNPTPAMREVMKKRRSLAVTPMKAVQRIRILSRSLTLTDPGSTFRYRYNSRARSYLFKF